MHYHEYWNQPILLLWSSLTSSDTWKMLLLMDFLVHSHLKEHYSVSDNHSQGKSLALNFLPNSRWVFLYERLFPDKNSLWWTDSVSKVKSKHLRLASKALCNLDPNYYPLLIFKYILLGRKPELLLILCLCLYVFIFLTDCPFSLNPLLLTTTLPFSPHPNLTFTQHLAQRHPLNEFILISTFFYTPHTFTEHLESLTWDDAYGL